jgi:hypothetical protein
VRCAACPAAYIRGSSEATEVLAHVVDEHTCFANVGSDSAHALAQWLALLGADFDASHDPELADELRRLAGRLTRAAG